MQKCHICGSKDLDEIFDFGLQPISNRFIKKVGEKEELFPLSVFQCCACGLVQITDPMPAEELRPPYDWITYNEPEQHLDFLSETIANLPGLNAEDGIWGVSFKDDSLLRRMEQLGVSNTYRLDAEVDLGIGYKGIGVETIQEHLDCSRLTAVMARQGKPRVVIARHIIEHVHDFSKFAQALISTVEPDGYLVLEVPDCQRAFELLDYTTIWEEHTLYFTPHTFRSLFNNLGLDLVYFEVFPNAFENSLVGIGKAGSGLKKNIPGPDLKKEFSRVEEFSHHLPEHRKQLDQYFKMFRERNGDIALFGAGHLACAFINYLGVKEHIAFVVDDNPNKQGRYLPGSGIPIKPSSALVEENVKLCLFSLSPEVEDKVVEKNQSFLQQGGQFGSIFPGSKRALRIEI